MFNRQSALTVSAALSARSRSTTASRSATSRMLVWCGVSQPYFCQSGKLIVGSYDEDLRLAQNSRQEMVARTNFLPEFLARVYRWIDFPSNAVLGTSECRYHVT